MVLSGPIEEPTDVDPQPAGNPVVFSRRRIPVDRTDVSDQRRQARILDDLADRSLVENQAADGPRSLEPRYVQRQSGDGARIIAVVGIDFVCENAISVVPIHGNERAFLLVLRLDLALELASDQLTVEAETFGQYVGDLDEPAVPCGLVVGAVPERHRIDVVLGPREKAGLLHAVTEELRIDRQRVAEDRHREDPVSAIANVTPPVELLVGLGSPSAMIDEFVRGGELELGDPSEADSEESDDAQQGESSDAVARETIFHHDVPWRLGSPRAILSIW